MFDCPDRPDRASEMFPYQEAEGTDDPRLVLQVSVEAPVETPVCQNAGETEPAINEGPERMNACTAAAVANAAALCAAVPLRPSRGARQAELRTGRGQSRQIVQARICDSARPA